MSETEPIKGNAYKKPWYEYKHEMQKAYETLRHAMGSYAFDTEYRQIKGYMEGYLAGMSKVEHEADL